MSQISFDNRVAIITGAGGGLGRAHALALAARGVRVVVNDLGGSVDGGVDGSLSMAENVVAEIRDQGGEAFANGASVTDPVAVKSLIDETIERFGKVDILVNNAGILRDKSFAKMTLDDFQKVIDVHLLGSAICTKAVWAHMRERQYGRIIMTTSSSGMYGNFGQANYGAAKAGLSGFMRTLCLEGAKYNIRVNCLSPVAATRMTQGLMPEEILEKLDVESVAQGAVYLAGDDAPNRIILCAGAGGYALTKVFETDGVSFPKAEQRAENIAAHFDKITDEMGMKEFQNGSEQGTKFVTKALSHEK